MEWNGIRSREEGSVHFLWNSKEKRGGEKGGPMMPMSQEQDERHGRWLFLSHSPRVIRDEPVFDPVDRVLGVVRERLVPRIVLSDLLEPTSPLREDFGVDRILPV